MKTFLKKSFAAGLIALLPIAGTIWLLKIIIFTVEDIFRSFFPERFYPENILGFKIPGIGLFIAAILILLTGMLTRFYLGKKIFSYGDKIFRRIPLGRGIYSAIKQFMSTIVGEGQKSFRKVVLAEYPNPGSYALGFVTSYASGEVQTKTEERVVNVFIPTTPTPTSGFLLMMPERKLIPLEMAVEDAFKLIVSGGVVVKPPAISSTEH